MNIDEIVADLRRAEDDFARARPLRMLRKWLATDEGTQFLISAVAPPPPPPRRWFRRSAEPQNMLPTVRVVAPATLDQLGELRGDVVGCFESEMSEREKSLVDGEYLCWVEWNPVTRSLRMDDGISLTVPSDVPIRAAVFGLLAATTAVSLAMMPVQEDEEEEECLN